MKHPISDTILLKLSRFIATNPALSFPEERWADLERNISSAARDGMPGEAIKPGAASLILSPEGIINALIAFKKMNGDIYEKQK